MKWKCRYSTINLHLKKKEMLKIKFIGEYKTVVILLMYFTGGININFNLVYIINHYKIPTFWNTMITKTLQLKFI